MYTTENIINIEEIEDAIRTQERPEPDLIRSILKKAAAISGLAISEAAALLNVNDPDLLTELFKTSALVKGKIYGRRIVLFAPLYISNECTNNCLYCGFSRDNKDAKRKTLAINEAVDEAQFLSQKGYKRLLLVTGEDIRSSNINYLTAVINAIYENTDIRILHINAPPMKVEDFKRLKDAGIGVYQSFQETYHPETYKKMHPSGMKKDYEWRITTMDRAIEAGFDDIGMGTLFGLYDFRFEALALIQHARYLEDRYGFGPHTVSVPRLQPASGAVISDAPYPVSDIDFKKIVAVYRLAMPYVGIVISTREPKELRDEIIKIGASQISAGSRTNPGGYTAPNAERQTPNAEEQFETEDHRSLDEMIQVIAKSNNLPSLCTACYRKGRTGNDFRKLADTGDIQKYCLPNAILTFQEYLIDYASDETKEIGQRIIDDAIAKVEQMDFKERLERIKRGERDIYY
ncbi:MAG: [FeFe] hydrogenase H-cluster radical SAM maturase HydG [Nitrospirota bacterium]